MPKITQTVALSRSGAAANRALPPAMAELMERRAAVFGPAGLPIYREPLHLVRAEGVYLFDAEGNRYLDAAAHSALVGHCHPRVAEAIGAQVDKLGTSYGDLCETALDYAERLLETVPTALSNVVLVSSGSEANDLALRLAKRFTGGEGFVVTEAAYHGDTGLVSEVSPACSRGRELPPHVRPVQGPDIYRRQNGDLGARFAAEVEAAIAGLEEDGFPFAGFIADPIFFSDGIHAEPAGFLEPAVEAVHNAGGLFIGDERESGLGRTGSHLWGFQRHGVTPDIVTIGGGMANGFPVAAIVIRPEILEPVGETAGNLSQLGGNSVAAVAGLAVLDVLEQEGLLENAATVGSYFRQGLDAMKQLHPAIGDVRSAGLLLGIEFSKPGTTEPDPSAAHLVINALKEEGVLVGAAGADRNVLTIRPPLSFASAHVDLFLECLFHVLDTRTAR